MSFLNALSVRTKLALLVGVSVVTTAVVAGVGRGALVDTSAALITSSQRIARHLDADMMHDALRADVMSAILASDDAARKQAQDDVAEHSRSFRDSLAEN